MKKMKRLLAALLALCMIFALVACGAPSNDDDTPAGGSPIGRADLK